MSSEQNCLTIEEFVEQHRIGRTTVYTEINAGRLKVRKVGKRRIITPEDAKAWRDPLPRVRDRTQHAPSDIPDAIGNGYEMKSRHRSR